MSKPSNDFVTSPKKQVSHKTNVISSQITTFKIVLFSFLISLHDFKFNFSRLFVRPLYFGEKMVSKLYIPHRCR